MRKLWGNKFTRKKRLPAGVGMVKTSVNAAGKTTVHLDNLRQQCILCGGPSDYAIAYEAPDGGKSFGAPTGKKRLVYYAGCSSCFPTADQRQAEASMMAAEIVIHHRFNAPTPAVPKH